MVRHAFSVADAKTSYGEPNVRNAGTVHHVQQKAKNLLLKGSRRQRGRRRTGSQDDHIVPTLDCLRPNGAARACTCCSWTRQTEDPSIASPMTLVPLAVGNLGGEKETKTWKLGDNANGRERIKDAVPDREKHILHSISLILARLGILGSWGGATARQVGASRPCRDCRDHHCSCKGDSATGAPHSIPAVAGAAGAAGGKCALQGKHWTGIPPTCDLT